MRCLKNLQVRPTAKPRQLTEAVMLRSFIRQSVSFLRQEEGPTAVEYAVMLALIVVVCIAAITTLGQNANAVFQNVALNTAASS
jgi:pilus assembly protein Flp/PilA